MPDQSQGQDLDIDRGQDPDLHLDRDQGQGPDLDLDQGQGLVRRSININICIGRRVVLHLPHINARQLPRRQTVIMPRLIIARRKRRGGNLANLTEDI